MSSIVPVQIYDRAIIKGSAILGQMLVNLRPFLRMWEQDSQACSWSAPLSHERKATIAKSVEQLSSIVPVQIYDRAIIKGSAILEQMLVNLRPFLRMWEQDSQACSWSALLSHERKATIAKSVEQLSSIVPDQIYDRAIIKGSAILGQMLVNLRPFLRMWEQVSQAVRGPRYFRMSERRLLQRV